MKVKKRQGGEDPKKYEERFLRNNSAINTGEDFDSFVYSQCDKNHHFFDYITKTLNLSKKDVSVFGPIAANETTSDRMRRRLNNFSSAKKEQLLLVYTLIRGGYSNPWLFYSKFKSCNEH